MYNVLDKLRRAEPLKTKEKAIHTQGLVSALKSLHDELDAAVLLAYGWANVQAALADLEQRCSGRGCWRDRLPTIVDTLEALGRARRVTEDDGRWQST